MDRHARSLTSMAESVRARRVGFSADAVIESATSVQRAPIARLRWGSGLLLMLPIVVVGVALSAVFASVALSSLTTRWPVTYPEGAQVAAVMRLRNAEPLYPPFLAYPYLIAPYPPVLYLVDAGVSGLLSLGVYETTVAARALTLAVSFAAAVLIGLLALREGAGRAAALAGGALFLPIPLLDQWAFAVRPDLLALCLSLAAGWALLGNRQLRRLAGVLAGLALLTKLTAVAMPLGALIWLVGTRRVRDAIGFAAIAAGTFGVGAGATLALSEGQAFGHTVIANMNPLLPMEHALNAFTRLPQVAWFPLTAAVTGLALQVRARRSQLSSVYWLLSLSVGLLTLRGRGGDVNYLIESAAATCWLAAHGFHEIYRHALLRNPRFAVLWAAMVVAGIAWGAQTLDFWRTDGGVNNDRRLPLTDIAAVDSVLAEEPTMVLLAGKPLVVSDPFNLSQLQTAGRFDPADLIHRIRQGEFQLVVLRGDVRQTRYINGQPKWPESVRRAIADYYVFSKRVDIYWLYVPDKKR